MVKVTIKYDGSNYSGWQDQLGVNNVVTLEEVIVKAVSAINRQQTEIIASGRTDRGVHALAQVFQFKNRFKIPLSKLEFALDNALPDDIQVLKCESVSDDFHARFSAINKEYHYYLNTGPYDLFMRNYVTQYNRPLDVEKMIEASKLLIGRHDFSAFNATPKSVKEKQVVTLLKLDIEVIGDIIVFKVKGTSFLRHMVRMIVGSLVYVGDLRFSLSDVEDLINNDENHKAPYNIEPSGLYLYEVNYDE